MVKSLIRIIYHGTKICLRSLQKSISEEIEQSRRSADIRYNTQTCEKSKTESQYISLGEAKLILNVENVTREEIEQQFKHLFQSNSKSQSGSFYLQSKVVRAKERLDYEIEHLQRMGKLETEINKNISDENPI